MWRANTTINNAEKKLLLLAFFVGSVLAFSGIYYILQLSLLKKRQATLNRYLLCELPGYIMDNENDMTVCSKDELEKYSYTGLYIAYIIFTYSLLPLVFLLTIIEWRSLAQTVKPMLGMRNASVLKTTVKYSAHNGSEIKMKDDKNTEMKAGIV